MSSNGTASEATATLNNISNSTNGKMNNPSASNGNGSINSHPNGTKKGTTINNNDCTDITNSMCSNGNKNNGNSCAAIKDIRTDNIAAYASSSSPDSSVPSPSTVSIAPGSSVPSPGTVSIAPDSVSTVPGTVSSAPDSIAALDSSTVSSRSDPDEGAPLDWEMDACIETKHSHRASAHRVFVNRSLHLEKIKYYGFDMDYTLAEYASPAYEQLGFELLQDRLLDIGYPEEIKEFQYDPTFPTRGLWFDKVYGNLLKVDGFGNILICVHGFRFLKPSEIYSLYPNKFIQLDENRIYVMNTLFNLPEIYMIACLVDFFSNSAQYVKSPEGIKSGELYMSYKSIFQDIRTSVDWIHMKGSLKTRTVAEIAKYVQRDQRLPLLLQRMKQSGAFLFLLTNSEYWYTKELMTYLLDFPDANGQVLDWKTFFHAIVVDACKPSFFSDGTIMRQVNTETGALRLGTHTGTFRPGQVYSGGSCDMFTQLVGAKGKDVLYVGDHIFGDILKSKKIRGWRTFLIVPELVRELHVWTDKNPLFAELQGLDVMLGDLYKNLDSSTSERPDLTKLRTAMREVTHKMDLSYGMMGSLFRSGSRQTHFSTQVSRYADVYASTLLNLIYYPFSYMFRAPSMLMPHESTVTHEQVFKVTDAPVSTMSRAYSVQQESTQAEKTPRPKVLSRANSMVPHAFAEAPKHVTHHHDDDGSDESSDEKSS